MNEYKYTQIGYSLLSSYTIVFLIAGVINLATGFATLALLALVIVLSAISTMAVNLSKYENLYSVWII